MKNPMKNQNGLSAIVLILILIIILSLVGGGFIAFQKAQKKNKLPMTSFEHIALKEDVVSFAFKIVPSLYNRLVWINAEITLIDKELDRLQALENDFPSQKKVVKSERAMWRELRKILSLEASSAEKKTDSFYVTYMVNKQKGRELINEYLEELTERIDEALGTSRQETSRLKIIKKETFIDKVKGLIS